MFVWKASHRKKRQAKNTHLNVQFKRDGPDIGMKIE